MSSNSISLKSGETPSRLTTMEGIAVASAWLAIYLIAAIQPFMAWSLSLVQWLR